MRGRKPRNSTSRGKACLALVEDRTQAGRPGLYDPAVRKLLKWIVVSVGITALVRWFKRRGAAADLATPAVPVADDPAEELRKKLAETREADEPDATPDTPDATVGERRADVHEQGRAAVDEMKPSDQS